MDVTGEFTAKQDHLFPAMKQNLGSQQFKDDCKVETAVIRWLKIWDADSYSMGNMKALPITGQLPQMWQGLHGVVMGYCTVKCELF